MDLNKFVELTFEWDTGNLSEIEAHRVTDWECEECFFNAHEVYRNKRKQRPYTTYRLLGRTDSGRRLTIIFFIRARQRTETEQTIALIRVITAWPFT